MSSRGGGALSGLCGMVSRPWQCRPPALAPAGADGAGAEARLRCDRVVRLATPRLLLPRLRNTHASFGPGQLPGTSVDLSTGPLQAQAVRTTAASASVTTPEISVAMLSNPPSDASARVSGPRATCRAASLHCCLPHV